MFVQIGYRAFNPDHIVDVLFMKNSVRVSTVVTKVDAQTGDLCATHWLTGEDYDAFMDWWNRCANVSTFPSKRGIIPSLTEGQVRHAQKLEAKMMKIRSQDAPSPDEWEEVAEIEEELAEMFCNILPAREEPCST